MLLRASKRFTRLAYSIVAGRKVFDHPCYRTSGYILDKLLAFQLDHAMDWEAIQANLNMATEQLPNNIFHREAVTLAEKRQQLSRARRAADRRSCGRTTGQVARTLVTIRRRGSDLKRLKLLFGA